MVSNSNFAPDLPLVLAPILSAAAQRALLQQLVAAAAHAIDAQLDDFALRLSSALCTVPEGARNAREVRLRSSAGHLLQRNTYAFYHLASTECRTALQDAMDGLDLLVQRARQDDPLELALVPMEEIEQRMMLEDAARPMETAQAELLSGLNRRFAALLGREQIGTAENPLYPAVILAALDRAWRQFDPDPASQHLLLDQASAGLFLDLAPILQAVDDALRAAGIEARALEHFQIRQSAGARKRHGAAHADPALKQQLRNLFETPAAGPSGPDRIAPALSAYLANIQHRLPMGTASSASARSAYRLSELGKQMPREAMSTADATTVDVMTRIFEAVFRDPNIPQEMKDLIGYLQIPVLKAALIDKEFFFESAHPARRLISLLTTSSIGWDRSKGAGDPLYQAIEHNVGRVQGFEREMTVFSDVVSNLEGFLDEQDARSTERIAAPIGAALQQEHLREATCSANADVAARVATGEVVAFVETFLERRWVPVLALAHSVKNEKPHVLVSATRTMDELIWSVRPKVTAAQRRDLVTRLPPLLTTLNKWFNVMKWDEADRLQFFADLAECHASIVRAPLELSPQRQLELAVQAAHQATRRRLAKRAAQPAPAAPDPFMVQVEALRRGEWLEFAQPDASLRRVKLAWISPLKSLYIFTTVHREEAISLAADAMALAFREQRVRIVDADGFVDQALVEALEQAVPA